MKPRTAGAPPAPTGPRYFTRAVGKALAIVRLLQANTAPQPLTDIARAIGLSKSSTFRLLYTLEKEQYVSHVDDRTWMLRPELRSLRWAQLHQRVRQAALHPLKELARETREAVSLALLFDNHLEVAAVIDSPHAIRMGNTVGRILPPHSSSLGKAVLAWLDADERARLVYAYGLPRYTPHTITEPAALWRDLDRSRERGYALDEEENTIDGLCVGVAIRALDGLPCGAISVSVPKPRWQAPGAEEALIATTKRTAARITATLRSSRTSD